MGGTREELLDRLRRVVGSDYVMAESIPEEFSHDATFLTSTPELVVRPADTDETSAAVKILYDAGVPITCRGAGTGLSGGPVAIEGGAVVCLDRLTDLVIHPASMYAETGAGVVTGKLQAAVSGYGLMYPPDPASIDTCTIGGNISTNAGGASCLKYGVTADYILGLTVVLGDGRIIRLGGPSRKKSSGYRLTQLFTGSEGTLGVVTEALIRLVPLPPARATLLAAFGSIDAAAAAVAKIFEAGILPAACELIDRSSLSYVSDLLPGAISQDAAAILLIDQDGPDRGSVASQLQILVSLLESSGASAVIHGLEEDDRTMLWAARRAVGARLMSRRSHRLSEDLGVPVEHIPKMVRLIHEIAAEHGVEVAIFGHAGDGNLHPSLIFDDREPATLARVSQAASQMFHAALDLGGTVSAEHGLGAIKRSFARKELGEDVVGLMRSIKAVLDPKGLMNPGKTFPENASDDLTFMDSMPGWLESG